MHSSTEPGKDESCLLIVEDDEQQQDIYSHILDNAGWPFQIAASGQAMRRLCRKRDFEAIILDLRLPDMDGLALLKEYRRQSQRPVLVVSVRDSAQQRVECFNAGASDYMIKPFRPNELLHRLRRLLPDASLGASPSHFSIGKWQFNVEQRHLFSSDGQALRLTPAECNLLQLLAEARGRVLSGSWLQDSLELSHRKSVDTLVYRLRQKIEPDPRHPIHLKTLPDQGYCLLA